LFNLLNIRWGPPISYGFCFIAPGPNPILLLIIITKVVNFFPC
jgi:hypothetical protein